MKLTDDNKLFTLYWLDGKREIVVGQTLADACNKEGYGAGAMGALDFFTEGPNDGYSWIAKKWHKRVARIVDGETTSIMPAGHVKVCLNTHHNLTFEFPTKDRLEIDLTYGEYAEGWVKHIRVYVANYCEGPYEEGGEDDHHYLIGGIAFFHPKDIDKAVAYFLSINKAWHDRHNNPDAPHLRKAYEDCFGRYDTGNVSIAQLEARQPVLE